MKYVHQAVYSFWVSDYRVANERTITYLHFVHDDMALPSCSKVLECIRHRHGLPEFAGGRVLLDPEYEYDENATFAASEDNGGEGRGLLFPGLRLLHAEPIVIGVDDFFTPEECDDYISRSVSPPLREYISRAGMGPFEQPAALDSGEVRHVSVCGRMCRLERFSHVLLTIAQLDPRFVAKGDHSGQSAVRNG